jgi:hypothetical protein
MPIEEIEEGLEFEEDAAESEDETPEGVYEVPDDIDLPPDDIALEKDDPPEPQPKNDDSTKLQENYDRASNHILDLNKTISHLRNERAESKKTDAKDEDVALSDEQIKGLLEAHEGDHGTTLEIIKHVSKQIAKGVSKDEIKTENIVKTQQELNKYMSGAYPMLQDSGSEFSKQVQGFKSKMDLADHPYADFLAVSSMIHGNIGNIQKESYEKGLADGQGRKVETTRKQTIKTNNLIPAGKVATPGTKRNQLSANEMAIAKEIGLTSPAQLKMYSAMLAKKKG